jgi:hypothetical protein
MSTSNDFSEYYKTISHTELLNILDNVNDYQPSAVEAARQEFLSRQLSETEIQQARQPLIIKREQKNKEREKVKAVETKIKTAGQTFIDTINPIQSGIPTKEKTIRLIVIVFGGMFLYQFVKYYRDYWAFIEDIPRFPLASILYLLPQIVLPIATIAFWKRKTFGWILLMVFLSFSAVGCLLLLYQSLTWKATGLVGLDNLFSRPSPTTYIPQLLFLAGTMYVLCRQSIRDVFSIDKQKMMATMIVTGLVTFILMFAIV